MRLFLIGYPLSGKSTIGRQIAKKWGCEFLSTGEYARSLGMKVDQSTVERDYSAEFNDQIERRVWEVLASKDCVIDGYPRSEEQLFKILSLPNIKVVYFYVNPVIFAERLKKRQLEEGRPEDTYAQAANRVKACLNFKKLIDTYIPVTQVNTGEEQAVRRFLEEIC